MGIGPSAHSFDGQDRGANPAHNARYLANLQTNQLPFQIEKLTKDERLNEYLLTGIRTLWGIDFEYITSEFGVDLRKNKKQILEKMNLQNWLIWEENKLSLTKSGKLLADSIAASLFV